MAIYIMAHKPFRVPAEQGYVPLSVGAWNREDFGYLKDSTGENISEKNAHYCELTGLYWLWKHAGDEYVGLVHYRRYFSRSMGFQRILSEKDALKKLRKHDILLPFSVSLPCSIREDYCKISGTQRDLDIVRSVIARRHPEYLDDYDACLSQNRIHFFNMMITSREIFRRYCEWLFDILFEAEKQVDLTGYSDYQRRVYGFLSERLLNVFVLHNHLRVFEVGVINTEERWPLWKRILTGLKRAILFHLP